MVQTISITSTAIRRFLDSFRKLRDVRMIAFPLSYFLQFSTEDFNDNSQIQTETTLQLSLVYLSASTIKTSVKHHLRHGMRSPSQYME